MEFEDTADALRCAVRLIESEADNAAMSCRHRCCIRGAVVCRVEQRRTILLAGQEKVSISHLFETHIHADLALTARHSSGKANNAEERCARSEQGPENVLLPQEPPLLAYL